MKAHNDFIIPFSSLKSGKNLFSFKLNKTFFEAFNWDEFKKCTFNVSLELIKSTTMIDMFFVIEGEFTSLCDRCMYDIDLKVNQDYRQLIKLVESEQEIYNDEIEFLSLKAFEINIAPYIFEYVLLSMPSKKVHTIESCNKESINILDNYLLTENYENDNLDSNNIDSRWDKLKELKNKKEK